VDSRPALTERPELIGRFRDDLRVARFTVARLDELLGNQAAGALSRGHRVPARRALDLIVEFDPAAVLARLFVLGLPADIADVAMALPTLELEGAIELGLVRVGDTNCDPLVDLRPYSFTDSWGAAEWWIASDLGELALGAALPEDHVLGVGGAAHGDLPLLAFGLLVSIPIVLFGSGVIAAVLDQVPRLIWLGALALIWTAADMILGDPAIDPHVADHWAISAAAALAILAVVVGVRTLRHRPA
jgi:hypothetical protein